MKISAVSDKHQPDWLRMRKRLYTGVDDTFHEQELSLITSSDEYNCYIAENSDEKAIGFIEVSLRNIVDGVLGGPVGYIEGLYLESEFRSKGYGSALISKAVEWFKRKGCKQIATDTEIENVSAQKYFEKLGFNKKWTIVQYLKDIA